MSGFTSFITSICTASIVIGALAIISPDGAISKSVKYALSLVFLTLIITAAGISLKQSDFSFDTENIEEYDAVELYTSSARYVYAQLLKNAEINFTKITVCTDKSEDGSIIISKVIIYSDCTKEEILKAIGLTAENYEVEIINE